VTPFHDRGQPGPGSPANIRLFVADLAAVAPLRLDPGQAAAIVWATNATELYQLLVGQRGWTPRRYQDFLTDTWQRLLLADLGWPVRTLPPARLSAGPAAGQPARVSGWG
jgi:hypothetical protein